MKQLFFKLKCYFLVHKQVKMQSEEVIKSWGSLSFKQKINVAPITLEMTKKIISIFYESDLEACLRHGVIPLAIAPHVKWGRIK